MPSCDETDRKGVGIPDIVQKRTLVQDTIAAARLEYETAYKTQLPVNADALEVALAQQVLQEKKARAHRQAQQVSTTRPGETADSKVVSLPSVAKSDATAEALERVLRNGTVPAASIRVGDFNFNPAAALRGPRGWPIIARLARHSDVQELARRLCSQCAGELAAQVAGEVYSELRDELYAQVEAVLRESYPIVAPLSPAELRQRLREAHAQEAEEEGAGTARGGRGEVAPEGQDVLGRKLALVRRVHALIVEEFNEQHGLRTRSDAAASLRRKAYEKNGSHRLGSGGNGDGGSCGSASASSPTTDRGTSASTQSASKALHGGERGGVAADSKVPMTPVVNEHTDEVSGWGRRRHVAVDSDDDEDDESAESTGKSTETSFTGDSIPQLPHIRNHPRPGSVTNTGSSIPERAGSLRAVDLEDEDDEESEGTALVIGVSSNNASTASRGAPSPPSPSWPSSPGRYERSPPDPPSSTAGQELVQVPRGLEARALWPSVVKLAENTGMASLRDALKCRGLDAATDGVRGAPRHFLLRQRVLEAVQREADAADAYDREERRRTLGASAVAVLGPKFGEHQALGAKFLRLFMEDPTRAPPALEPSLYRSPAALGKALLRESFLMPSPSEEELRRSDDDSEPDLR